MMTIEEQIAFLKRGTTHIISENELAEKLKKTRPLRVKLGVDPTAADVTLGWAVVLRKLRDFQQLGHIACLIIGDFTACIGDPSGKNKTRPQLTRQQVEKNVLPLMNQIFKILDKDKTEIFYNADWLGKMNFEDVIKLASKCTVARMLERDDFSKRLKEEQPISMHEFFYPLCQAYDSIEIQSDIELGGNDQLFNNLMGRNLMASSDLEPQVVMLCPLLIGTDGKDKMSQSLGNYISISDSPRDMYGKCMSIPDNLIENWLELVTDVSSLEISELVTAMKTGELNPKYVKMRLARELVLLYHGLDQVREAEDYFENTFAHRKIPEKVETLNIPKQFLEMDKIPFATLLTEMGLTKSNSEARRLIQAGGIQLQEVKLDNPTITFLLKDLQGKIVRIGKKKFCRINIEEVKS